MGPEVLVAGLAVSFLGSAFFGNQALEEKEAAIDYQQAQQRLKYQKDVATLDRKISATLDHQLVQAYGMGVGINNPTFQAFALDTLSRGSAMKSNLRLENELQGFNAELTKSNLESSYYANLFGNLESLGTSALTLGALL